MRGSGVTVLLKDKASLSIMRELMWVALRIIFNMDMVKRRFRG